MPDPARLVTAALAYAGRGWPVFMLGRTKRPVANCPRLPESRRDPAHDRERCSCLTCHGFYAATTDPDRVAAIVAAVPAGQLALRTGAASGTGRGRHRPAPRWPYHHRPTSSTADCCRRPRTWSPGRAAGTCTTGTPAAGCHAARASPAKDSAPGST